MNTFFINKSTTVRAAVSLALISAASVAFAQGPVVNQSVVNSGTVGNVGGGFNGTAANDGTPTGLGIDGTFGVTGGTSATLSVSATGAVASVSVSAINSPLPMPSGGFGDISQSVVNNTGANITNVGSIDGGSGSGSIGTLGTGGSAAVSASGAVASVSVSAVADGSGTVGFNANPAINPAPSFVGVEQTTVLNNANVGNSGSIVGFSNLGNGASASVSATGAVASVSFSAISSGNSSSTPVVLSSIALPTVGTVTQNPVNEGNISNGPSNIQVGYLGYGASASAGATGAVAAVSVTGVNADLTGGGLAAGTFSGGIGQTVLNTGTISNTGATVSDLNAPAGTGFGVTPSLDLGSSLSASATGAVASISYSNIGGTSGGLTYGGTLLQNVSNQGSIQNGSSATPNTISVTPAAGSVFEVGSGASLSVGATGAVASVSNSNIGGATNLTTSYAAGISQSVDNKPVSDVPGTTVGIYNNGTISAPAVQFGTTVGGGDGASASVSATGAVGSVSSSFIDASIGTATPVSVGGNINQGPSVAVQTPGTLVPGSGNPGISNEASISNTGLIQVGTLYGAGSSASIGATGAVGSVSYSEVNSSSATAQADYSNVYQNVQNSAPAGANQLTITNVGTIDVASLPGTGSSASVSATGSVASFSVSTVDSTGPALVGATVVPLISQGSFNSATISNTGNIVFGSPASLGNGASASVAATGAVASASFRAVH